MDERLKRLLHDLINIVDYMAMEIESTVSVPLEWERSRLQDLRRRLEDIDVAIS